MFLREGTEANVDRLLYGESFPMSAEAQDPNFTIDVCYIQFFSYIRYVHNTNHQSSSARPRLSAPAKTSP